ncbi:MAG: XdhC family protein [Pseudobutyrivibrio sp.]|nr:XdhC family protein [Pseudobutyrivibrio sp.]
MDNRFEKLLTYITDNQDYSKGLLIKRDFGGNVRGRVSDIATNFIGIDDATQELKDIALKGLPLYDSNANIFFEPFFKQERLIILGAGHLAVPLSMMAKLIGFYVVVIDDREDFADSQRFPYADEVLCNSFYHGINTVKPKTTDYVVIVTRGHAHDEECIETLMKFPEPVYTGLIGSKKRVAILFDKFPKEGEKRERLNRIYTPIGLNIGAKTIEEIDIAIMAELIKVRRMDSVSRALVDRCDHDMQTIVELSKIKYPCAIVTILKDEGSTPRAAGAVMAVFLDGTIIGSIGGGCVERSVILKAKQLISTGQYEIIDVSLDGESAMAEGMVCGGRLTVLIEDFDNKEIINEK